MSTYPPLDGSLTTLTDLLDYNLKHNADAPWFTFPSPHSPGSIASITFQQMAASTHRTARILRPSRSGSEKEVVVLLIHTDTPRYVSMVLGVMRAGWVPYPVAPDNHVKTILGILRSTKCRHVVVHSVTRKLWSDVEETMGEDDGEITVHDLQDLFDTFTNFFPSWLVSEGQQEEYPPALEQDTMSSSALYMHSSGTTGLLKSVLFTWRQVLEWIRGPYFLALRESRLCLAGLPTFHLMGLAFQLCLPLYSGQPVAVYTPEEDGPPPIPSAENVLEVARTAGCTVITTLPSFVEVWSRSDDIVSYLRSLDLILYTGGPLSMAVGDDLISKGVIVGCLYGGTKFANPVSPPLLSYPDRNWSWLRFASEFEDLEWVHQGDGTYELVVHETECHHLSTLTGMDPNVYATKDLFVPHPMDRCLWKFICRKDDVITLKTGEKIVPVQQERRINASPVVAGVMIFGEGRSRPGVLIEPQPSHMINPDDQVALQKFRNDIWSDIQAANNDAPDFAQIFKEMIIVTHLKRPLPRASRGVILRAHALQNYANEINSLYIAIEQDGSSGETTVAPASWTVDDLRPWIQKVARSVVPNIDPTFTTDLFGLGFDSLSATLLRNRLIASLRASGIPAVRRCSRLISSDFVFEHSTIDQLAIAFVNTIEDALTDEDVLLPRPPVVLVHEIEAMQKKQQITLSVNLQQHLPPHMQVPPVVLITGITDGIGSHILASLLADTRVSRVFALTTGRDMNSAFTAAEEAFREWGLPTNILSSPRLELCTGDAAKAPFSFKEAKYAEMLRSITHIVHNAWTNDLYLPLRAFEDDIVGVGHLLELVASAPRPIQLLVTSSVGVASKWDPQEGLVPERALENPEAAATNGYTASKYVMEKMLEEAAAAGVQCTVIRIAPTCGPLSAGTWSTAAHEWFPALVKCSIALGQFPAVGELFDWIPLDIVADIYCEWLTSPYLFPPLINMVHPRAVSWTSILAGIMEGLGKRLPVIPIDDWTQELSVASAMATGIEMAKLPRRQILNTIAAIEVFLRSSSGSPIASNEVSAARFDTSVFRSSSAVVERLEPLSDTLIRAWTQQWKEAGYIILVSSNS